VALLENKIGSVHSVDYDAQKQVDELKRTIEDQRVHQNDLHSKYQMEITSLKESLERTQT